MGGLYTELLIIFPDAPAGVAIRGRLSLFFGRDSAVQTLELSRSGEGATFYFGSRVKACEDVLHVNRHRTQFLRILQSRLQPRFGILAPCQALDKRCAVGQFLAAILIVALRTPSHENTLALCAKRNLG